MATTRAVLRENLGKATGIYVSSSATSNGAADGTTVVDTAIVRNDASLLADKWLLLTSGTYLGQSRRISIVSSSTITLTSAYGGQVVSGVTYEIFSHDPELAEDALEEAGREVYPDLYVETTEFVIVDNLLANPSFEEAESTGSITVFADYDATVEGTTLVTDASHGLSTGDVITISGTTNYNGTFEVVVVSTSTFWIRAPFIADDATGTWVEALSNQEGTASGWTTTSGTWTFPTQLRRVHGKRAASCTAAGSLTQNLFRRVNVIEAVGKTLHIRARDFATGTSTTRLRASFDGGTTFTNGTYHGGDDEWEGPNVQALDVSVPAGPTSITVHLQAGTGSYFDLVAAWIDRIAEYPLTSRFVSGPSTVEQQVYEDKPNGLYLPLGWENPPISGRLLKITGMARLTVPTSDTQVVELDEARADLLIAEAAVILYRRLMNVEASNREEHARNKDDWEKKARELRKKPGIVMHPLGADEHEGWRWRDGVLLLDR